MSTNQEDKMDEVVKPKLTAENFPTQVDVKFITNTYPERVTETPFKLPADLTRLGLSEIINHLLNHDPPTPFEFLIEEDGEKVFLRTSLKEFFLRIQQYPEETVVLEYVEAQPAPKQVDSIPHDDWVSAISCVTSDIILTGCYDGIVRVINQAGKVVLEAKHDNPVTDLAAFSKDGNILFATSTKSQNGTLWKLDKTKATVLAVLKGHTAEMECLDFNPLGNMICSGSADNTIKIWETDGKKTKSDVPQSKKTKTHDERNAEIEALGTLVGHNSIVSAIEWGKDGNVIISGSYDHSIRLWDVVRANPITTINGNKVVTTLSFNQELGLIASGHPDHIIRTWDPRAKETKPTLFKSHKSWIRQVQWGTQYQFLSGADDNMAKVWDIRSSIPLHSIIHNTEPLKMKQKVAKWKAPKKVLAVSWAKSTDKKQIYTGSNDCTLKRHTY